MTIIGVKSSGTAGVSAAAVALDYYVEGRRQLASGGTGIIARSPSITPWKPTGTYALLIGVHSTRPALLSHHQPRLGHKQMIERER